jgi:hypothetical protein
MLQGGLHQGVNLKHMLLMYILATVFATRRLGINMVSKAQQFLAPPALILT